MRRSVIIVIVFGLLIHVAGMVFNAHGIMCGDCRPVRLVALFTPGLMAILMVAMVYWRMRDAS